MLKDMENLVFGIWCAHGEGRYVNYNKNNSINSPIKYVDNNNKVTMEYPYNPNGSELGIAAICSDDGRHLAMMPHPERSFLKWQLPWYPDNINITKYSPWFMLFTNSYEWCNNL